MIDLSSKYRKGQMINPGVNVLLCLGISSGNEGYTPKPDGEKPQGNLREKVNCENDVDYQSIRLIIDWRYCSLPKMMEVMEVN